MIVAIIFIVVTSISGFFGKAALEKTGGLMVLLGIGVALASSSFSWLWVVAWLIGLFIGWAIVVVKEVVKEESGASTQPYAFESTLDAFSVVFPKKPQVIDTGDYSRQYIAKSKGVNQSVTVYDLREAKITRDDMLTEVMNSASRVLDFLGIEATETRSFEGKNDIDGRPSIRLSSETDKGTIYYFAAVMKTNKLYELVLNIHGENDEQFVEFVNSFKFTNG